MSGTSGAVSGAALLAAWARDGGSAAAVSNLRAALAALSEGRAAQAVCVLDASQDAAALRAAGFEVRGEPAHHIWALGRTPDAQAAAAALLASLPSGPPVPQRRPTTTTTTTTTTEDKKKTKIRLRGGGGAASEDEAWEEAAGRAREHKRRMRAFAKEALADWRRAVVTAAPPERRAAVAADADEVLALLRAARPAHEAFLNAAASPSGSAGVSSAELAELGRRAQAHWQAAERAAARLMGAEFVEPGTPAADEEAARAAAAAFSGRYEELRAAEEGRKPAARQQRRAAVGAPLLPVAVGGGGTGGKRSVSPARSRRSVSPSRARRQQKEATYRETFDAAVGASATPTDVESEEARAARRTFSQRFWGFVLQVHEDDNYDVRRLLVGVPIVVGLGVGTTYMFGLLPSVAAGLGAYWVGLSRNAARQLEGAEKDREIIESIRNDATTLAAEETTAIALQRATARDPIDTARMLAASSSIDTLAAAALPPPQRLAGVPVAVQSTALEAVSDAVEAEPGVLRRMSSALWSGAGEVYSAVVRRPRRDDEDDGVGITDSVQRFFYGDIDSYAVADGVRSPASISEGIVEHINRLVAGGEPEFGDEYSLAARALLRNPDFGALLRSHSPIEREADVLHYLTTGGAAHAERRLIELMAGYNRDFVTRFTEIGAEATRQLAADLHITDVNTVNEIARLVVEGRGAVGGSADPSRTRDAIIALMRRERPYTAHLEYEMHFGDTHNQADFARMLPEQIIAASKQRPQGTSAAPVDRWLSIVGALSTAAYLGSVTQIATYWMRYAVHGSFNALRVAGQRLERSAEEWMRVRRELQHHGRGSESAWSDRLEHFRSMGWLGFTLDSVGQAGVLGMKLLYHPLVVAAVVGNWVLNHSWTALGYAHSIASLGLSVISGEQGLATTATTAVIAASAAVIAASSVAVVFILYKAAQFTTWNIVDLSAVRAVLRDAKTRRLANAGLAITWNTIIIGNFVKWAYEMGRRSTETVLLQSLPPVAVGGVILSAAPLFAALWLTDPSREELRAAVLDARPWLAPLVERATLARAVFFDQNVRLRAQREAERRRLKREQQQQRGQTE